MRAWSEPRSGDEAHAGFRPEQDASEWVRFYLTAYHQQAQTARFGQHQSEMRRVSGLFRRRADGRADPGVVGGVHARVPGSVLGEQPGDGRTEPGDRGG